VKHRPGDERILFLGVLGMLVFVIVAAIAWLLGPADGVVEPETSGLETAPPRGALELGSTPEVVGRLSEAVRESSGIAVSRADSTLLWTHNDGPDGRAFLIRRSGELVGVVRVVGADVTDIEDIALGECPEGMVAPGCLYLADTGDNSRDRDSYAILVAPEPEAAAWGEESTAELGVEFTTLPFRYPDGSHDAEALTLSPTGEILVITKGQEGSAEAFRITADQQAVPLGTLPIDVSDESLRPTGAALSPSGSRIVVRSDEALFLFSADDLSTTLHRCDLPTGRQGEAVDFITDSLLIVTSEGIGASLELVPCP
jgi:hypothetical protein